MSAVLQAKLADYLRERAKWLRVANDAEHDLPALEAAAREVEALSADDLRLAQLDALEQKPRPALYTPLNDDSGVLVDSYGLAGSVATVDALLDRLIECEAGASVDEDHERRVGV
ncbi:MAG: hypothetical protein WBV77_14960 [Solirubrobacteraceae bacterium]